MRNGVARQTVRDVVQKMLQETNTTNKPQRPDVPTVATFATTTVPMKEGVYWRDTFEVGREMFYSSVAAVVYYWQIRYGEPGKCHICVAYCGPYFSRFDVRKTFDASFVSDGGERTELKQFTCFRV